jgi:DNA invertase Pin-like site-specific DNA recombinase
MRIGYARISDKSQNLESQIDILSTRNVDEIVEEVVSGVLEKDKLNELVERLQPSDVLVVARHDRLGRNTLQLLELIQTLKEKNVSIEIVNLGLDSSSPFYEPLLAILSAFSEMERSQLKEKQRLGIEAAKRRGKNLGRRREFTKTQLDFAVKLYIEGKMSIKEIEESTNVSKSSLYRELDKQGIEKKGIYIAKKH